jgi:hypothetical protein
MRSGCKEEVGAPNVPEADLDLKWSLIFEWCVVGYESKIGHPKNMCLQEIGLRAQHLLTILDVIVSMIKWTNIIVDQHNDFC